MRGLSGFLLSQERRIRCCLTTRHRSQPSYNSGMPLRIVISPQAFKHSIGAREAALAIQRGVLRAAPDSETILIPVADGGDGTLAALIDTTGGSYREATVTGPLGDRAGCPLGRHGRWRNRCNRDGPGFGTGPYPRRPPQPATRHHSRHRGTDARGDG